MSDKERRISWDEASRIAMRVAGDAERRYREANEREAHEMVCVEGARIEQNGAHDTLDTLNAGDESMSLSVRILLLAGKLEELEAERNDALRVAQDARNDNAAINRELDRLGAPKVQPSGFGYAPIGRLRCLAVNECGEGLKDALMRERDAAAKKWREMEKETRAYRRKVEAETSKLRERLAKYEEV